jgi:uncharacterized protein YutE (UPF0331/DUF86 family)
VLDAKLASSFASAVRFRNLLIHEYAAIDDVRVVNYFDRLDELDAFVSVISSRLKLG